MLINAKILRSLPITVNDRNDSIDGVVLQAGISKLVAWEDPSAFYWGDEIGFGHTERTYEVT